MHRHHRNLGSPVAFSGLVSGGGASRGRPEDAFSGRQGGGLRRSTVDDGEGKESLGGKASTIGDPACGAAGPDAELGTPACQPRAGERRGQTVAPDPVHGAVPSPRHRCARTSVPASEAAGGAGRGRDDDGGVRARFGENLRELHVRLHAGRYRPKPVLRTYIPKADGGQRPLGITALEDKIVQSAVAEILNAVYEADFRDCSYGFRPGRSAHGALRAIHASIITERVNWVVDADIRNFFGSVNHSWLERMIAHRIADPRILRLIRQWLRAGVLEDGVYENTEVGTPQGAGISPILANIYLHYALDLWVEQWARRSARRPVRLVQFADDYLLLCEDRGDALRLMEDLRDRLGKFRLALHGDKTRLVEFGRFAAANRARRGEGRPRPSTFWALRFTAGRPGRVASW